MRSLTQIAVALLIALVTSGCSGMKIEDFAGKTPQFLPEEYFAGETSGRGVFFDRFGDLKLGFAVELQGSWDGKVLILNEQLKYDSGEKLTREYRITKVDEHRYTLECSDLAEPGEILAYGNALNWRYRLKQDIGGRVWVLTFDDWMYLQDNGVVLNRAYAKKFGILLGEVFMAVKKESK